MNVLYSVPLYLQSSLSLIELIRTYRNYGPIRTALLLLITMKTLVS